MTINDDENVHGYSVKLHCWDASACKVLLTKTVRKAPLSCLEQTTSDNVEDLMKAASRRDDSTLWIEAEGEPSKVPEGIRTSQTQVDSSFSDDVVGSSQFEDYGDY